MTVTLQRIIHKWTLSGQGDDGVDVNDGDVDHEDQHEFGSLANRPRGALDRRAAFLGNSQPYLLYFWEMLDKYQLLSTAFSELNQKMSAKNGGEGVPSAVNSWLNSDSDENKEWENEQWEFSDTGSSVASSARKKKSDTGSSVASSARKKKYSRGVFNPMIQSPVKMDERGVCHAICPPEVYRPNICVYLTYTSAAALTDSTGDIFNKFPFLSLKTASNLSNEGRNLIPAALLA
jgi:hypothetical protein